MQLQNKWKVILAIIFLIIVLRILIWIGYIDGTGFGEYFGPVVKPNQIFQRAKTLWDWMELLIVPAILVGGAYLLNESARQREKAVTEQRTEETALQAYLDKMTDLLLDKKLCESEKESEVRAVARVRTLTVLRMLDKDRKGALLRFLYEAGLIDKNNIVIDLSWADLSEADLRKAHLNNANLSKANLRRADLRRARLNNANLSEAHLNNANLSKAHLKMAYLRRARLNNANLSEAHLNNANLSEAKLSGADLSGAKNLSEAKLSGAKYTKNAKDIRDTKWPDGFDPDDAGAILIKE